MTKEDFIKSIRHSLEIKREALKESDIRLQKWQDELDRTGLVSFG